jgi:hypothetical protein
MTYGGVPNYDWPARDKRARLENPIDDTRGNGFSDLETQSSSRASVGGPPESLPFGITSHDLAFYIRDFAEWQVERVTGPGLIEYDRGSHQAFETMTSSELVLGAQEELCDLANYLVMLSLKLGRVAQHLPKESNERDDPGSSRSSMSPAR